MPPLKNYPLGSTRRLWVKFRSRLANQSVGPLVNPISVSLKVEWPNGEVHDIEEAIPNPETGIFYFDYEFNLVGTYRYRWNGDGSVMEGQLNIMPSDMYHAE